MVKTYLKYELSDSFGVVASSYSNSIWTSNSPADPSQSQRDTRAGYAYVGANEEVLCWDVKKGELISSWRDQGNTAQVTVIQRSIIDQDLFAVGYSDGSIRIWDARLSNVVTSFNGHRSAITHLAFDRTGTRLASGSRDTDIIVWDLVGETGLFKLRGHKEQITGLHFIQPGSSTGQDDAATGPQDVAPGFLISTSKDALIKIWDVASQYCLETHVTQSSGECWALGFSPDETGCITAGNDGELKFWLLDADALRSHSDSINSETTNFLTARGTIHRQGKDRTVGVTFHSKGEYFAVHGAEKAVEIWRVRSADEVKKVLARKRRRRREKDSGTKDKDGDEDMANDEEQQEQANISDVFVLYVIVKTGGKLRSVSWSSSHSSKSLSLLAASSNNQLELYQLPKHKSSKKSQQTEPEYTRALAVDLPGHRTDVRAISLSSDDRILATASNGTLKVWNVATQACVRTLDCGYALCCMFLPGDKIVLVGTKSGEIEMFDIASSALVDTVKAHDGAVWSMRVAPDGKSVASGGADKAAKFWRFDVVQESIPGTRRTTPKLQLKQTRQLKLNDDVLALCFSPDSKYLAVSTLDNTVKVFFTDSLNLYLTLYGHKLPVLSISIAADSKLLATCSADKNIRLWGLDFGDCHRALFAHDDSIMAVSFIPDPPDKQDATTLFSVSKDNKVKTWDAQKFQPLQTLAAHHAEVWCLAVSRAGDFAVSASHDRSIRVWRQSDEPLFLEEERERELEDLHDASLTDTLAKDAADADALALQHTGAAADAAPVSKQTGTTLTAGEKIAEALALALDDLESVRAHADAPPGTPAPQRNPILTFQHLTAEQYLLGVLQGIPAAQLTDALLLLPFSALAGLFTFLTLFLEQRTDVSLACRIAIFLLETHHRQIVAAAAMRPILQAMQPEMHAALREWKGVLGWNLAACRVLGERAGTRVGRIEDVDVDAEREERQAGRKRAFVGVAS